MIVHEACQTAGYGGEIAAIIADSEAFFHLDAPIRRVAGLDVPIPYNPVLEAERGPDAGEDHGRRAGPRALSNGGSIAREQVSLNNSMVTDACHFLDIRYNLC